jgi:hypothetical protein
VREPRCDLPGFALNLVLFESVDEFDGGEEASARSRSDAASRDGGGEMGFARSGRDSDMAPGFWRMRRSGSSTLFIHWRAESSPPLDAASCLAAKRI